MKRSASVLARRLQGLTHSWTQDQQRVWILRDTLGNGFTFLLESFLIQSFSGSNKIISSFPYTLPYFWLPKAHLSIHQHKNWLWTKSKSKKIRSVLWLRINVWLPHESCRTVQIRRSEFQSQPSHSLGISHGCFPTEPCHSICQRINYPRVERNTSLENTWKWSSEVCFLTMDGPHM